jgi:hypothetical protein
MFPTSEAIEAIAFALEKSNVAITARIIISLPTKRTLITSTFSTGTHIQVSYVQSR